MAASFAAALVAWVGAALVLAAGAGDLASGRLASTSVVLAAHLLGVGFFPLAVTGAAWHVLPPMLRNPLGDTRRLWAVPALLAGGPVLAAGVAISSRPIVLAGGSALAAGAALALSRLGRLVLRAPRGRRLAASRTGVVLAGAHAVAAFALGGVVFAVGGPEPLGVPYERLLLIHVLVAVLGWLTLLVLAVGRTLVPMLALAPAPGPRRAPWAELAAAASLWLLLAGIGAGREALVAAGTIGLASALARPAAGIARSARGSVGVREGPAAHAFAGAFFAAQAGVLSLAAAAGLIDARRAATAAVVLLLAGWAGGVVLGHLGKLLALSAWANWPSGPRPKQAAFYPRRAWQAETAAFALAVQLLAAAVLVESGAAARIATAVLAAAVVLAVAGAALTFSAVTAARRQACGFPAGESAGSPMPAPPAARTLSPTQGRRR